MHCQVCGAEAIEVVEHGDIVTAIRQICPKIESHKLGVSRLEEQAEPVEWGGWPDEDADKDCPFCGARVSIDGFGHFPQCVYNPISWNTV